MNFTRTKITVFFIATLLLGWFLYPRELVLGYIYEGLSELKESEATYLSYLGRKPHNRFASLRLANVYERMAEPERATPLLKALFDYRKKDWRVARAYLDQLEMLHDEETLDRARLEVVRRFKEDLRFPRGRLEELLYASLQYAWHRQDIDRIYAILGQLTQIARRPDSYLGLIDELNRGLKRKEAVLATLKTRLAREPSHRATRLELVGVMSALRRDDEAMALIGEGLAGSPDDPEMLKMRVALNKRGGRPGQVIRDLEHLLRLDGIEPEDRLDIMGMLGGTYESMGELARALEIYRQVLREDKSDLRHWQNVVSVYTALGRDDEAIETARECAALFPESREVEASLAELSLYKKKDISEIELYRRYVRHRPRVPFAQDVANLLMDRGKPGEAARWLESTSTLFPFEVSLRALWMDALLETDRPDQALEIGLLTLQKKPNDVEMLFKVAGVYGRIPDRRKAQATLERIETLAGGRPDILKRLGRELVFLGRPDIALRILKQAAAKSSNPTSSSLLPSEKVGWSMDGSVEKCRDPRGWRRWEGAPLELCEEGMGPIDDRTPAGGIFQEIDSADPEILFWMMEAYAAQGRMGDVRRTAREVVALLEHACARPVPTRTGVTAGACRFWLKGRARLQFSQEVIGDYEEMIRCHPKDFDLRADFIELLVFARRFGEAEQQIAQARPLFPKEGERLQALEAGGAFEEKDWPRAIRLMEALVASYPRQWAYRRDLAATYARTGRWRESIAAYEGARRMAGEDDGFGEVLGELHREYDQRIAGRFRFVDLGSDTTYESGLGITGFLDRNWSIHGDGRVGFFKSPGVGFSGRAEVGRLAVTRRLWPHWRIEGGGGFGISPQRKTADPFVVVTYVNDPSLRLSAEYDWRALRVDLPQAVAAGALIDRGRAEGHTVVLKKVIVGGKYDFSRSYLPTGARVIGHSVEPFVSFILLSRPYLALGYQFNFMQNLDRGGYLNAVSLIPKVRAHYVTATASHRIFANLYLEGGGFIGADAARGLSLTKAELFGGRARLEWGIVSWLDLEASYEYGRESLLGVGGRNHQVGARLSGHWL